MLNLKNISLLDLGFIPGMHENSNIAMAGFLDMPSRGGKTFHDWGLEHGIEPYVSTEEIFFSGIDIKLVGYLQGRNYEEREIKRQTLVSHVNGFTDLVPFESVWGSFNVLVKGKIDFEELHSTTLKTTIEFRVPQPIFSGVVPVGNNSAFGIDGISFSDLGGFLMDLSGDVNNRTSPKPGQLSAYGKEAYQVTKTVAPETTMKLLIDQPTYTLFEAKVAALQMLFASPGLRTIRVPNDKARTFFVKDGFKVSNLYFTANRFTGIVECKLTEAALFVAKLNQLITFQPFAIKLIDDEDFAPSVSVNSGLAITLTSSNSLVATIINGMIHIVGTGTSVITATQAGDDTYNAAAPKSQTLTVRNGLLSFPYQLPHFITQ